jgi:circadian clock protein KaiC
VIKKRRGRHERLIREFALTSRHGVSVGEPIREFNGVLTGAPTYLGASPLPAASVREPGE